MPLNQDIEQRHSVSDLTFEVSSYSVADFFEMTEGNQHRQDGFDHHAIIPCSLWADLQIGRIPALFYKMRVSQNEHVFGYGVD